MGFFDALQTNEVASTYHTSLVQQWLVSKSIRDARTHRRTGRQGPEYSSGGHPRLSESILTTMNAHRTCDCHRWVQLCKGVCGAGSALPPTLATAWEDKNAGRGCTGARGCIGICVDICKHGSVTDARISCGTSKTGGHVSKTSVSTALRS